MIENDVKLFKIDKPIIDWYNATNYQSWAFFDFINANDTIRYYKSKNTKNYPTYIEIPIDNIPSEISFTISSNENNIIYYNQHIIISNNENYRQNYKSYYKLIMDNSILYIYS